MLGNFLENIDTVLSSPKTQALAEDTCGADKGTEDASEAINVNQVVSPSPSPEDESLQDRRKVTFSESIMEKTISSRTSYESAYHDLSHELYKSIDSGLHALDISLNSDLTHSPTSKSKTITSVDTTRLTPEQNKDDADDDPFSRNFTSPKENFFLRSPFADPVFDEDECRISDSKLDDSNAPEQAQNDSKNSKLDANEEDNLILLDGSILGGEQFQSTDNISDILTEEESIFEDGIQPDELKVPMTPKSVSKVNDELQGLFSPGTFFSQKSGNMGKLDGHRSQERPLWYTPKVDDNGKSIDPIDVTPADRLEKYAQTPRGSRLIRPPLYTSPSHRFEKGKGGIAIPNEIAEENKKRQSMDLSCKETNAFSENRANLMHVRFPPVESKHSAKLSIYIKNPNSKTSAWILKSIGPVHVTLPDCKKHSLDDRVFQFKQLKGRVEPLSSISLIVTFLPLITGHFQQTFQLRTHGQVVTLELQGKSKSSKRLSSLGRNSISCSSVYLTHPLPSKLDFGSTTLHHFSTRLIQLCNNSTSALTLSFNVTGTFVIPTKTLILDPFSFVEFPIIFVSSHSGCSEGCLVVNYSSGQEWKIQLYGQGFDEGRVK